MIDAARINRLMTEVEQVAMAIPALYRESCGPAGASLLATEQRVLQLLRKAAHAVTEARALVSVDPATLATVEALHARIVERLIASAHLCMALEEAELLVEASRATKH